jgi:hypothetical protein
MVSVIGSIRIPEGQDELHSYQKRSQVPKFVIGTHDHSINGGLDGDIS